MSAYDTTSTLGKRSHEQADLSTPATDRLFQCSECGKSYSRVDHLARHVRLHTKEKPYSCETCGKGFARADLLKRHVLGHDTRGDHEQARKKRTPVSTRVAKACEACADLHLRCDEHKPCSRCEKKSLKCIYGGSPVPGNVKATTNDGMSVVETQDGLPDAVVQENTAPALTEMSSLPPIAINTYPEQPYDVQDMHTSVDSGGDGNFNYAAHTPYPFIDAGGADNPCEADVNLMASYLQSIMGRGDPDMTVAPGQLSGTWTPRNVFDFGQDTNLELSDVDLGFLNIYNLQNPFADFVPSPDATQSVQGSAASNPPSALAGESLQRRSTWRFRPVVQDSSASEQQNLSLPTGEANKKVLVERRMTAEPLSYHMRDRILAILISSCRGSSVPRFVLCFPSLELLDSLLQFYLASKVATFSGLVHLPTLSLPDLRPDLVAAMIAAGATLTPDASLQKIGFAIQEALRVAVPELVEANNTLIADLQCLQCMVICLGIGLWSGNSRKMELSESFLQPYLTMIRRRGWFLRSAYPDITPLSSDEGSRLEEKWSAWVSQESRKRLVFSFYLHAVRQSISLFTNPLISYAEMGLPLPAVSDLWLAPSASQWKVKLLSTSDATPSLVDVLHDVDILADSGTRFSTVLSSELILGSAWGLVWEYRQICSVMRGKHTQWSTSSLVLSSRLTELSKLLECIRISAPTDPKTTLFVELLLMHLYVPLEEVHLFAGAEGYEEARRVFPQLEDWAKTSASREAVFHAAQLVSAARNMGQGCLRDFWAIAVYQAALTMWTYGVITSSGDSDPDGNARSIATPTSAPKRADSIAVLDSNGSSGSQRFIAMNRGQGAITGYSNNERKGMVLLSDPSAIMKALVELLEANHKMQHLLPPLVTNLASLMNGLQVAVADQ
ncbi:hypothetical protein AAFC00_003922 [Neodothiora populina]|uniref:Uncharacterized protein n=1 Tax=Neodothiora populina TaxID=2781224 RepID=A0ABR3PFT0_9PEZI